MLLKGTYVSERTYVPTWACSKGLKGFSLALEERSTIQDGTAIQVPFRIALYSSLHTLCGTSDCLCTASSVAHGRLRNSLSLTRMSLPDVAAAMSNFEAVGNEQNETTLSKRGAAKRRRIERETVEQRSLRLEQTAKQQRLRRARETPQRREARLCKRRAAYQSQKRLTSENERTTKSSILTLGRVGATRKRPLGAETSEAITSLRASQRKAKRRQLENSESAEQRRARLEEERTSRKQRRAAGKHLTNVADLLDPMGLPKPISEELKSQIVEAVTERVRTLRAACCCCARLRPNRELTVVTLDHPLVGRFTVRCAVRVEEKTRLKARLIKDYDVSDIAGYELLAGVWTERLGLLGNRELRFCRDCAESLNKRPTNPPMFAIAN